MDNIRIQAISFNKFLESKMKEKQEIDRNIAKRYGLDNYQA